MAEVEAAGGSPRKNPCGPLPRKKPCGEKTFLLRIDRAKAAAERGRTEPIGLEDPQGDPQGDPDDPTEAGHLSKGGCPKKAPPKTTKPPPVTQEYDGVGDLDSEEEEFDKDDNDDDGLERRSVVNDRTDGGRPKEDNNEELDAAPDEATRASIPAHPRGTKRNGGENDRTDDGGCPKKSLPKMTGDLDDVDEELDDGDIGDLDDDDKELNDGDIEDNEGLKDEGKTVPVMLAGTPPHQVAARRWTEDIAVQARAVLAWEPRGHPPSNVVRPDKPYNIAARALSALRDSKPDRNPRFVQDHSMESDEEANSKANPSPPKCRQRCVG